MRKNDYPNNPSWKNGSPETSREAANSIADAARSIRKQVLAAVTAAGPRGLTGDEVAAECELTVYQVRSRIAELRAAKLVDDSKRRERLASGRPGAVWVLKQYAPKPDGPQGDLLAA